MSSGEEDLSADSELCLGTDDPLHLDVDGNACDSCSQRSLQDPSVKLTGHLDDTKSNCDNNSLQQEVYCEKIIYKGNYLNAACQTSDREDNSGARKNKNTLAESINLSLSNTNESKSCMNISHQENQETSCNKSTYSM